jgi:hypothetical protein
MRRRISELPMLLCLVFIELSLLNYTETHVDILEGCEHSHNE